MLRIKARTGYEMVSQNRIPLRKAGRRTVFLLKETLGLDDSTATRYMRASDSGKRDAIARMAASYAQNDCHKVVTNENGRYSTCRELLICTMRPARLERATFWFVDPILAVGRVSCIEARPTPYSVQVEAVEVHHLGPGLHKVPHELLFSVSRSINLRNGAQLGVRPEHQVNRGRRPLDLAGRAIESLVNGLGRGGLAPLGGHIEQVYEEVIAQRPGTIGEHPVRSLSGIGIQGAHAAD